MYDPFCSIENNIKPKDVHLLLIIKTKEIFGTI